MFSISIRKSKSKQIREENDTENGTLNPFLTKLSIFVKNLNKIIPIKNFFNERMLYIAIEKPKEALKS